MTKTVTSDFKQTGSTLVLVGRPDIHNLGGSTYFSITQSQSFRIPHIDLTSLPKVLMRITHGIQKDSILSCHDVSEGGLAGALAEMAFGAGFGAEINLRTISKSRPDFILFNETAGTFLVEVENENAAKKLFKNIPYEIIGKTIKETHIRVLDGKKELVSAPIDRLKKAWQKPMKEFFN